MLLPALCLFACGRREFVTCECEHKHREHLVLYTGLGGAGAQRAEFIRKAQRRLNAWEKTFWGSQNIGLFLFLTLEYTCSLLRTFALGFVCFYIKVCKTKLFISLSYLCCFRGVLVLLDDCVREVSWWRTENLSSVCSTDVHRLTSGTKCSSEDF